MGLYSSVAQFIVFARPFVIAAAGERIILRQPSSFDRRIIIDSIWLDLDVHDPK